MSRHDISSIIRLHEDTVLFREAINFTAAQTLFLPRLIEKDYYCTVLLNYLAAANDRLVFKDGTCLAKVHAGFHRLSEDLDFVIPTPFEASRSVRRSLAAEFKKAVIKLPPMVSAFRVLEPPVGANNSKQYVAVIGYSSLINQHERDYQDRSGVARTASHADTYYQRGTDDSSRSHIGRTDGQRCSYTVYFSE